MNETQVSRHMRLMQLLQEALELEEGPRHRFLDEIGAEEPTLEEELRSLLDAASRSESFLEPLVPDVGQTAPLDEPQIAAGEHFGPYRVVEHLGHGGMSVVYLAIRDDDEYQSKVALKFLRREFASKETLQRLRTERQILATLDHPNIARLFDGGTTEEGVPYLVMEYIDGIAIDRYCAQHELSIPERLELFRQVCSAVRYAHRKLVVHRDLKPSNILVNEEGIPKLLDFGIAKPLNPEPWGLTVEATQFESRMLTPQYASPEQLRGEQITTASDVYSLGVLLFKLLTGLPPYDLRHASMHEIVKQVCETEPVRPSQRLLMVAARDENDKDPDSRRDGRSQRDAERLRRQLEGDLDAIVLKALRKEPEHRYDSPDQLSDDVRRHLEGLPVLARQGTFAYRLTKYIGRHRISVGLAALVAALLIAFVAVLVIQSSRIAKALETAQQERDRARQEEEKAKAIHSFLQETLSSANPESGADRDMTVVEALRRGASSIEETVGDQPEIEAAVRDTLGRTFTELGQYEIAEDLIVSAVDMRQELHGTEHPDVAVSLFNLGLLRRYQGLYDEAESLFRTSLQIRRARHGEQHLDVAASLEVLGMLSFDVGELEKAEKYLSQSLRIRRQLLGNEHRDVANNLNNLAVIRRRKADYDGAERLYRESLDIQRKLLGDDHLFVAGIMSNLAVVLREKGEYDEAEPLARETLSILRKVHGERHPNVARAQFLVARLLDAQGDDETAESLYRRSLRQHRDLLGAEHPSIAEILDFLALLLQERGELQAAEELYVQALMIYRRAFEDGHWRIAKVESDYGTLLAALGRPGEAEERLSRALATLEASLGSEHPTTVETRDRLAELSPRPVAVP